MAAIEYRGLNAVTNFDLSRYIKWLRPNLNNPNPNSNPNPNLNPNLNPNPNHDLGLSFNPHQIAGETTIAVGQRTGGATTSSALGLLLQSSKFKEMLERTSAVDCPLTPPESDPPRCSFPEDIQTYFECQDSGSYPDGDDGIFGDLNSFAAAPMFPCLDAE